MPAESEVGNGQVPQLQVQNEDNETVIIQNGGPKKVSTENSTTTASKAENGESKQVENLNQTNESASEQQNEVEKIFSFLHQVEQNKDQSGTDQCEITQVETVENEPNCPLRTTDVEETKTERESEKAETLTEQFETETQQLETEHDPKTELEEVEVDKDVSCPLRSATPSEEPKVDVEVEVQSCPLGSSARAEETKVESQIDTNTQLNNDTLQNGNIKKVSMFTTLDQDAIKAAYEDVRSDNSETQWAVFKFEGSRIALSATGAEFEKFREQFTENERAFGYIRIQTGDEMSKRQKFLFITWVGPGVSVIQRAKMSTDKSLVKNIVSNFAVELQLENETDFDLKHFVTELNKAAGANYGTGIREF